VFKNRFLKSEEVGRLGRRAAETVGGHVLQVATVGDILSLAKPLDRSCDYLCRGLEYQGAAAGVIGTQRSWGETDVVE
jgi:hypothetical protein